jgi:hypothetical protein
MKTITNRYRGLDGIIRAAHDATILAAAICAFLIATI